MGIDTRPLTAAATLTPGLCPAAWSTAIPWPFCTITTVMVSGITSSAIAARENSGGVNTGEAMMPSARIPPPNCPETIAMIVPITAAIATGGATAARRGAALNATKMRIIGSAISGEPVAASISSKPKRKKMPATIAMTIVGGRSAMIFPMSPVHPSRNTKSPVAR